MDERRREKAVQGTASLLLTKLKILEEKYKYGIGGEVYMNDSLKGTDCLFRKDSMAFSFSLTSV